MVQARVDSVRIGLACSFPLEPSSALVLRRQAGNAIFAPAKASCCATPRLACLLACAAGVRNTPR